MKKHLLAGILSLSVLLSGCSALLERDYSTVTAHNAVPATEGDPSILRADSYQELVNALIYFVTSGMEEGTVRPVLEPVLDFILDRRETCEILFRSSEASGFIQTLQQFIRRNGEPLIETWFHPQDQALTDYFLSFLTWGFIGLLKEWFDQGMSVPREELIAAAQRAADGAASYFFLKEKVSKKNFLTRRETVREGGACSDRRKETRL